MQTWIYNFRGIVMTTNEIIAQILMSFSILILLVYTVLKVSRRTILVCNMAINLLQAIHYFLMVARAVLSVF